MYGAKAKLLGRKRCLCQNLIINPPYCEKVGRPRVAVFKAKVISVQWSSQLSPMGTVWRWLWEWLHHSPFLLGRLCSLPLCLSVLP